MSPGNTGNEVRYGWTPQQRAIIRKRNAIIVHMVLAGEKRKAVAERFGLSLGRVGAIVAQHHRLNVVRRLTAIDEGDHV